MNELLAGPAALVVRYLLILAAGWLGSHGLAVFDEAAGTITIHIESAAALVGGAAALAAAVLWRKAVARVGGKT